MQDVSAENREKLVRGMAAGAIATLLMTGLLFVAPVLGGVPDAAARAMAELRSSPLLVLIAIVVHFGYGSLAGAIYAAGASRVTLGSGVLFGAALWGVAVAVYAPLL